MTTELPPLDIPCPHCTPDHIQAEMIAARNAWLNEEQDAYEAFGETYDGFEQYSAWKDTDTYRDLQDREPDPAGIGCVECDYTSLQLTDAGRVLLDFLGRHKAGAA